MANPNSSNNNNNLRQRKNATASSTTNNKKKKTPSSKETTTGESKNSKTASAAKKNTTPKNRNNNNNKDEVEEEQQQEHVQVEETLSDTFFQHPLVRVAPFVIIPFLIYKSIYYLTLKHPEIVNLATLGLANFRPAMKTTDPRQVLIIGAEVAENRYVTGGMGNTLKLEIVHEAFNAQEYFCRDGSVSWFQFMRFLEPLETSSSSSTSTTNENDDFKINMAQVEAWQELCIDRSHSLIELFHPKQYYGNSNNDHHHNCSSYQQWSPCWAQQCLTLVNSIWGCAWKEQTENDDKKCPHSFSKVLHQVRHPIHTIDFLNATICSHPKLQSSFLRVIKGWFPHRDWDAIISSSSSSSSSSCLDAMGWYEVDFQNTLLRARDAGLIDGMFPIETTSPCDVANQAGFLDEFSALYEPNAKKVSKVCRGEEVEGEDDNNNNNNIVDNTKPKNNNNNNDGNNPNMFAKFKKHNEVKVAGLGKLKLENFNSNLPLREEIESLISKLGYGNNAGDSEFL